jgi:membrane-anchored protein YejM (alkaline phosphatase superfamily)
MKILAQPWFLAAARAVNALFCLTTAIYAVLTSSAFAYEQFIQPNMLAWLSNFVFLHADLYWLSLCLSLLTLAPYLRDHPARRAAWTYIVCAAALGAMLVAVPVLPSGNQPARSIAVALVAMVPVIWLALLDYRTAPVSGPGSDPQSDPGSDPGSGPEGRMLAICVIAAIVVWAIYASMAPLRLRAAGGLPAGSLRPAMVGAAASLIAQLTLFTIVFLVWSLSRAWSIAVFTVGLAFALQRIVFVPIAVTGPAGYAVAAAIAVAIVLMISGIARHIRRAGRGAAVAALVLLPLVAWAALAAVTPFDWGFMLQKLSALLVAAIAFSAMRALLRRKTTNERRWTNGTLALPVVVLVVFSASVYAIPRIPQSDFMLDAYSAGDPAYRLARQFLDASQDRVRDADFYSYLRANSSLSGPIDPVSIDFVSPLTPPSTPPPNVFLFVIDSLRRDYVSPYNRAVTFTPRLAEFARDSVVFERAFSRYGGTGLAVPAIWAGAMLPHKQYVTPFAPMNALGTLIDAAGYRRAVTRDHITEELFGFPPGSTELDRQVPEMLHTFCGTMAELQQDMREHAGDRRPLFAHTRPLDLHIGNTRFAAVPAGESYPEFFAPYAARVKRIDGCFGEFVDYLKSSSMYDDSVVIVMSDHGDSLGEGLRWGHGYTVVPEVLRIPLIVHLPDRLRQQFTTDASRVAFATDVTPTLYALLGYAPSRPRAVAGVPLFVPAGTPVPSRRREATAVASSYGAVYGLVRHNGRRLYIADAIEGRDSLYDLGPAGGDARIGMTDAERLANRALIREQIADLAAWYGLQRP